ncbi:MAG: hypothetical protein GX114_00385 [Clostridiales bacterium]|nr:hypothetical protein [Clostridiales bacterium]
MIANEREEMKFSGNKFNPLILINMKRFFIAITLVAVIIIAGCTDLDDIYSEIDLLKKQNKEQTDKLTEFEAWLRSVEQLTNTANSDIVAISGLIDALNKKVSVVSYKELADKSGYELSMSDGSKITLKHGAKGDKGDKGDQGDKVVMGTKPFGPDDRLYWTIDGEWLLDANGNKVPATGPKGEQGIQGDQGEKGEPGLTPTLRINTAGHWEMSLDNGITWQEVKDENGNPVQAVGPKGDKGEQGEPGNDGDANLTITETAEAITITFNGTSFVIPKGAPLPQFDVDLLIGKWNMLFIQEPNNRGGWRNIDPWQGYWMHFMDAANGSCPGEMYEPFTYTLTEGNKLNVSEITWQEGPTLFNIDNFTIIHLNNDYLILEFVHDGQRMRQYYTRGVPPNPLKFVTKYNLNPDAGLVSGTRFVTDSTACDVSGYFDHDGLSIFVDLLHVYTTSYYLPSVEEWRSIMPGNTDYVKFLTFFVTFSSEVAETVMVQGKSITMKSDFLAFSGILGREVYAIRYKGTSMVSAWKYEYIEDGNKTHMKITSRSFYGKTLPNIWNIRDEFKKNDENEVIRDFPASGYIDTEGVTQNRGTNGYFWSSTPIGNNLACGMSFSSDKAYSNYIDKASHKYSIRLFVIGD